MSKPVLCKSSDDIGTLTTLCTRAANDYHTWLSKNRRGTSETAVLSLHILDEDERAVALRISKKIPDTEGLVLSLVSKKLRLESPHNFTIREYDADRNTMIVVLEAAAFNVVKDVKPHEIMVISDLLFLMKRLYEWYRDYGDTIVLPSQAPAYVAVPDFFQDAMPLDEQESAIRSVLSSPLSYVWGAPGTGKTQTVLAYAIIAHIHAGHRVAVFAPTNNALEQVLRGVLPMIDKAGVSRRRIVRVGNASAAFAREYPEVCGSGTHTEETNTLDARIRTVRALLKSAPLEQAPVDSEQISMFSMHEPALQQPVVDRKALEKELDELRAERERIAGSADFDRLHSAAVVAATLDGFVGILHREKLAFDHVFIDEAGYASIVRALPVFSLNAPVTLSGDHCQLPPVCELSEEDIRRDASLKSLFVFSQPIVELETALAPSADEAYQSWLSGMPQPYALVVKSDLTRTWRFGTNLAALLNTHVYRNGFSGVHSHTTEMRVIHADTPFEQLRDVKTKKAIRRSIEEGLTIQKYVVKHGCENAVILTPYVSQIRLLGDLLPEWWRDQRILTVHGSQGREWDEVILSVTDTDLPWFTDSKNSRSRGLNLINTAVSRAKKRLTIVCNVAVWEKRKGQLLADLIAVGERY